MERNAELGQRWWGKLTDDDLEQAGGNAEQIVGVLQQKYGYIALRPLGQLPLWSNGQVASNRSLKRRCFVNTTYIIIAVVLVLVIIGAILGLVFARRRRAEQLQDQFGPEYDHTVQTMGDEKKAQTELDERQKHVEALDIRPLSDTERERYLADWTAVQSKFVDEPGQAIVDADRLIIEVMQIRGYPVSDFEQRAADISVNYPALVSNYRAAREIAIKNKQQLRQILKN